MFLRVPLTQSVCKTGKCSDVLCDRDSSAIDFVSDGRFYRALTGCSGRLGLTRQGSFSEV